MRKRSTALIISAAFILSGCVAVRAEISEEQTTVAELPTATEKTPEIATEGPAEAPKKASEVSTTETTTEAAESSTVKVLFVSEIKAAERTATPDKERTGEINADGYGWVCLQYAAPYNIIDGHLTRENGSIQCFGHRETWYNASETVKEIPGRHVAEDGTVRDKNGYICTAATDRPLYSVVMTSVGPGKVYDVGCSWDTVKINTEW